MKLFGCTALGYEAIWLYGHMAANTELHSQILNLVRNPFIAEPIFTLRRMPLITDSRH